MTANTPAYRAMTAGSGAAPERETNHTPDIRDAVEAIVVRGRIARAAEALGEAMRADDLLWPSPLKRIHL